LNTLLSKESDNEEKERIEMFQAKKKLVEQNQVQQLWKEYDDWGVHVSSLKSCGGSEQMLQNLTIRVKSLEEHIGIPPECFIVKEFI
jgi:hypothetical protein